VVYKDLAIDLSPQGRKQKLELGYHLSQQIAQKQAWFSSITEYIREPNHRSLNPDQFVVKLIFTKATD
jgi:hypothetical protein